MKEQIVVNENLISYYNLGSYDGNRTLIFLHGWRSSSQVWRPIIFNLQSSIFNCYALDLPGFDGSQIPSRPFMVGDYAEVVAEFIKRLNLKNVILIGHSFGGRIGIKLAATRPELISKLVLVDSAGIRDEQTKKKILKLLAKIVKPIFLPKFMQTLRKKIYQKIGAEDYLATPELQKTFVNVTNEDLTEEMKKITIPTLIIFGENDIDTPPSFGKRMHSLIPNSKFQILKNAGHFSFLDRPQEFVKALKEFLNV